MAILRDFQFWGVVGTFLGIVVALVIYLLQRNKKRLAFQILTETPLLSVNDEIKGKIQIKYEKKSIQNIYLVVLKIENIGNVDITSSDYEDPIIITFPDSEILSVEVSDAFPKNLKPVTSVETSKLIIDPILLNKKDFITFKLVFSQYKEKIDFYARIVGVKEIERGVTEEVSVSSSLKFFLVLVAIASTTILSSFFFTLFSLDPAFMLTRASEDIGRLIIYVGTPILCLMSYIYAYIIFTKRKL